MTKPEAEYGVRLRWANGTESDSGPCSLAYARLAVDSQRSDKASWNPRAVAVLVRRPTEWQLYEPAVAADLVSRP